MKTSEKGIAHIKREEGFRAKPYLCSAEKATIGYGSTYYPSGRAVTMADQPITEVQADEMMRNILAKYFEPQIGAALAGIAVTQGQFDALVSLAYNIGVGEAVKSTAMNRTKAGNIFGAADAFLLFNKIRKHGKLVASKALTARREREKALYLS